MKRPLPPTPGEQLPLAEMDPKAFEKAPATRGFFLDTRFAGEDTERAPGTMTLRADGSRWTATLRDPSSCTQMFIAAPTLSDLWKLVEAVLGDDKSPWVDDPWARARRPKGGGKRG